MNDTLTIGSSHRETLNIAPLAKEGEPQAAPILISGAVGLREGITSGIERGAFRAWLKANADHPAVVGNLLRVVAGDAEEPSANRSSVAPTAPAPSAGKPTSSKTAPAS